MADRSGYGLHINQPKSSNAITGQKSEPCRKGKGDRCHVGYGQSSLKGGYKSKHIADYYRSYDGGRRILEI